MVYMVKAIKSFFSNQCHAKGVVPRDTIISSTSILNNNVLIEVYYGQCDYFLSGSCNNRIASFDLVLWQSLL